MTPPLAFIVSLLAWLRKANRSAAIAGVVISGMILLLYFGGLFVSALCR